MIKIKNLKVYWEQIEVLKNINLEIKEEDYLVITGENGAGKSTLIKAILGLNKTTIGSIEIDGINIKKYNTWEKFGYIAQKNILTHDISITVEEYLNLYYENINKAQKVIEEFKVKKILKKKITDLSGGQFQKINIIKALSKNIKYLILDEPDNSLDIEAQEELYEILYKLNKSGICIIIISHNFQEVKGINKVYNIATQEMRYLNDK